MFQIVRPPIEPAGASLDRSGAHPLDFAYDCETLVNTFTCTIEHIETGCRWIFEISDRCNHSHELYAFIDWLRIYDARMVGFNNVGFDYPVIHLFWQLYIEQDGVVYAKQLHEKAMSIIGSYGDNRFQNIVWERDRIVRQLDLYLIHHFDNRAKTTGLKMLEFQMRSGDIEVMEDDPNEPLPEHRTPVLIKYNAHDVRETVKFYFHSLPQITMRDELSTKYGIDFTNFNDTKIGKQYFINRLEAVSPGICHTKVNGKRQPRQTHRDTIDLNEIIFPYIQFSDPDGPFPGVLQRMRGIVLDAYDINSPPQMKDLSATYKGFKFDFGAGGIHGSQHGVTVRADDRYMILDIDVTSYYPSLAIANRVFPEHLGETFCDVYAELKAERLKHPKKSVENGMLKLALNGVYGDSNNQYGPFYDPQYTMTITVNGQLLLTMLAEKLMFIPNLTMLQINTDGLTVRVERHNEQLVRQVCEWWQNLTGMQLEDAEYSGRKRHVDALHLEAIAIHAIGRNANVILAIAARLYPPLFKHLTGRDMLKPFRRLPHLAGIGRAAVIVVTAFPPVPAMRRCKRHHHEQAERRRQHQHISTVQDRDERDARQAEYSLQDRCQIKSIHCENPSRFIG
jgi:hypothetical protein